MIVVCWELLGISIYNEYGDKHEKYKTMIDDNDANSAHGDDDSNPGSNKVNSFLNMAIEECTGKENCNKGL